MKTKPAKKKATITGTIQKMILAGRSDKQIWAALKLTHKLADNKKWYISWNRAAMRRSGKLPAAPTVAPLSDEVAA